ncbi:MAG: hypothetical protein ACRCZF_01855 [Gemmataceae bacterium]
MSRFRWIGILLVLMVIAVAGVSVWIRSPAPPVVRDGGEGLQFGWVAAPEWVGEVPAAPFRETPAFRAMAQAPDDLFLWEACRQVTGAVLPARDQGPVGACVGFGTASAIEHLACVQIASGRAGSFRPVAAEVIYAGSRVEIGGNRIRGDGSVGAWAARFVRDYGVLPRSLLNTFDLRSYDPARCREWGNRGVPDELEPALRQFPVQSIATLGSWAECRAAIRQGYPGIVCSSQGFEMKRDADGACRPRGTWMHCMAIIGVRGGARPGGFLLNSWGAAAHTGPRVPANAPVGGFWCDAAVLDQMLRQGDSWAFSQFRGFPAQSLDWYAERPPVVPPLPQLQPLALSHGV